MSIILRGGVSGVPADVTAGNAVKVSLSSDPSLAGAIMMYDSDGVGMEATEQGYLKVSLDTVVLVDQVEGAALNTNIWGYSNLTQTVTQANGFMILNTTPVNTVNTYVILSSIKQVSFFAQVPVAIDINAKVNILPSANATMEIGVGLAATTAAPTDGAFFRWNTAGEFRCVINNGGAETLSGVLTAPTINESHLFGIVVVEDLVQFFVDDVPVAEVAVPVAQAYPFNNGHLPVMCRTYTGAIAPTVGPQIQIGQVSVIQQAINQNKLWKETLIGMGRGAYQSPITAYAQTANHTNNSTPASAALANATAGYATLGGRYQFAAPVGAATDFILFAYQVPVGYQLYVTSIAITAMNTGAAVATTPTILEWAIGVNSQAITLLTVDGANTWATRRIPLGLQGFPLTAPNGPSQIGDSATDIVRAFDPPLVVDSARYCHVIVQVPVGTATASQIIRGTVTIGGYFE